MPHASSIHTTSSSWVPRASPGTSCPDWATMGMERAGQPHRWDRDTVPVPTRHAPRPLPQILPLHNLPGRVLWFPGTGGGCSASRSEGPGWPNLLKQQKCPSLAKYSHSLVPYAHPSGTLLTPRPHPPCTLPKVPLCFCSLETRCQFPSCGAVSLCPCPMLTQRRRPRSRAPGELGQGTGRATKPSLL